MQAMSPVIEFDNVYRRFDKDVVLRGLDFRVEEGQIFALLGRNGTGKTTALRILLGFLAPHHGEARVLGVPSTRFGPTERGAIGYVNEGHKMYGELTVAQTLSFEDGTRPRFQRKFADEAIRRLGLPPRKHVRFLSRGQRAQLALVIAIASRPKVLVLDDPALGLDTVLRREFLDVMIDFLSGHGATVLFSSHILSDVERVADRIGILDQGRLLVDAPLEDLRTRVEMRTWRGDSLPSLPCILRSKPGPITTELCLLDPSADDLAKLAANGNHLSEATHLGLEDLFLQLTQTAGTAGLADALAKHR
ncbi:MAG: ABC transporter ATP-binding protein [Planctomycetota bacterium]